MGNPGGGVMSTFPAPAWKTPVGVFWDGAGSDPEIDWQAPQTRATQNANPKMLFMGQPL
jgi:hypothetical protein